MKSKAAVIEFFRLDELGEFARLALEQVQALMPTAGMELTPDDALAELVMYQGWRNKTLRTECVPTARRSYALTIAQRHLRKVAMGLVPPPDNDEGGPQLDRRTARRIAKMQRNRYDAAAVVEQATLLQEPAPGPDRFFAEQEVDEAVDKYCPLLAALAKGVSLIELRRRVAGLPGSRGTPKGVLELALREECEIFARIVGDSPVDVWQRASDVLASVAGTRGKYKPRTQPNKPRRVRQPAVMH